MYMLSVFNKIMIAGRAKHRGLIPGLLIGIVLAGCSGKPTITLPGPTSLPTATNRQASQTAVLKSTDTSRPLPTITETSEPLAVMVNGVGISLTDYHDELARYQAAQKAGGATPLADKDQQKVVIDDMVDNLLLAQAAIQAGHQVADKGVQAQIDALSSQLGGAQALTDWENQHGYNDASFRRSLITSLEAAWERDQIIDQVPETADQVHVRQILVYNEDDAKIIYSRLQAGADFATLAQRYDPIAGGDLDWFPQGFLTVPEVDQAAFSLAPGKVSDIIKSKVGFHIIQVIERDPKHPLTPQTRAFLQKQALQKWMDDQRARSKIEIFLPG